LLGARGGTLLAGKSRPGEIQKKPGKILDTFRDRGLDMHRVPNFPPWLASCRRLCRLAAQISGCPRHDLFSAERAYGVDFIRRKIDEKKRERASEL
jgi:hypothetical protein